MPQPTKPKSVQKQRTNGIHVEITGGSLRSPQSLGENTVLNSCKTMIVSLTITYLIAIGLPAAAIASPPTHLPPPPEAAISCQDPASALSPAECEHFIEIMRHLDRVSVATLENLAFLDEIQTELVASAAYQDYLNQELSEIQSIRLQSALDRRAKFLETLSNLMKRISDTAEQITQNLK